MIVCIRQITSRLIAPRHKLRCSSYFWNSLVKELEHRGGGKCEAGAFLLGQIDRDGRRYASTAVYYDDLEPAALSRGYVVMTPLGYAKLWDICERTGKKVVADVHTHPGVALQSESDQYNPMIARKGHLAIIIPNYARRPVKIPLVGLFEFSGNRQWKTLSDYRDPEPYLYVAPWA